MSVGGMEKREDRPAYVRFQRRAIEDRAATQRDGRYRSKDVDFALVTPPYSRDVFEQEAPEWLAQMRRDAGNGRLPQEWYERYVESYERWKRGEEMPLNGTPIKGWPVISPAQMTNLIAIDIRTVEDLAAVNDEGLRRLGMGASSLRDKAKAWLSQAKDKGPLTVENAALKADNQALKTQNEALEARVKELAERLELLQRGGFAGARDEPQDDTPAGIEASDIIEAAPPPQKRGPGRPRKHPQE